MLINIRQGIFESNSFLYIHSLTIGMEEMTSRGRKNRKVFYQKLNSSCE